MIIWFIDRDLINNNEEPPEDGQKVLAFKTPLSIRHTIPPVFLCTQWLTRWTSISHLIADFLVERRKIRYISFLVGGIMDCFIQEALTKGPCLLTLEASAVKVFIQSGSKGLLLLCVVSRGHVDGADLPAKVLVDFVAHAFFHLLLAK